MIRLPSALSAILLCFAVSAPCFAQTAPTYGELLRNSQRVSPRIAAGEAEVQAAKGDAAQAAARPNPTLGVELENFGGSRPLNGLSGAESTVTISQPIELGGKRRARVSAARADITAAEARAFGSRIDLAFDLAVAYANAEAAAARLTIAAQSFDLARDDARVAKLLVDNGREARVRFVQADAVVAGAQSDLDQARADEQAALARLAALAASSTPFVSVAGGVLDIPLPSARDDEPNNPSVLIARAARDAARYRVTSTRRSAAPDLTLSLGARRLELENATALLAGASLPLPLFNRNQGAITSASSQVDAAEARLAQAVLDAVAERKAALAMAEAAVSRVASQANGERAAAESYRLTRIGYEAGKLPLSDVLTARRALIEASGRILDARVARARAAAELARAQGTTLAGDIE